VGRSRVRWNRTIATPASGMPMRKHHRQPSHEVSTRTPPSSGPPMVEVAVTLLR
jgi:hypothetical protein